MDNTQLREDQGGEEANQKGKVNTDAWLFSDTVPPDHTRKGAMYGRLAPLQSLDLVYHILSIRQ